MLVRPVGLMPEGRSYDRKMTTGAPSWRSDDDHCDFVPLKGERMNRQVWPCCTHPYQADSGETHPQVSEPCEVF